jgi:Leucine-rich repeat (LRR) protein
MKRQFFVLILLHVNLLLIQLTSSSGFDGALDKNVLSSWFENIENVQDLLDLSKKIIKTIDLNSFDDFSNLNKLYLQNNEIAALQPSVFSKLVKLHVLKLNDNKLVDLDAKTFEGLGKLYKLSLKNNQLKTLADDTFSGLVELAFLELLNNKIAQLGPKIFQNTKSLNELSLEQNETTAHPETTNESAPDFTEEPAEEKIAKKKDDDFDLNYLWFISCLIPIALIISFIVYIKKRNPSKANNQIGPIPLGQVNTPNNQV